MTEVKKTSIQIPIDILIKIKAMAVKEGTTQNTIINNLIVKGMENIENNKGKIKAEVINSKMPFYNPEKKASLEDVAGIIKLEKPVNSVELKRKIHSKEDIDL